MLKPNDIAMPSAAASPAAVDIRFIDDGEHLLYHGAKVAEIIELANRSPRRPEGLGAFSVAALRQAWDPGGYVQIRATSKADGPNFAFHLQAVGDIAIDVETCARHLLEAAYNFERSVGTPLVGEINSAIAAAIAPADRAALPMRVASIGLCPTQDVGRHGIAVDVQTLGNDLRTSVARIIAWDLGEACEQLASLADQHLRRDDIKRQALDAGGIGWIDGAAHRTLAAAGLPLSDAVRRLEGRDSLELEFTRADGRDYGVTLQWIEGVIRADVVSLDDRWSFDGNRLSIRHPGHPEAMITAWTGRRIGAIIEQDFVPEDALIMGAVDAPGGWLDISLAIASILVCGDFGFLPESPPS